MSVKVPLMMHDVTLKDNLYNPMPLEENRFSFLSIGQESDVEQDL